MFTRIHNICRMMFCRTHYGITLQVHINRYLSSTQGIIFSKKKLIYLVSPQKVENICCGHLLEAPCWGPSNEYPCFCGETREIFIYMLLLSEAIVPITCFCRDACIRTIHAFVWLSGLVVLRFQSITFLRTKYMYIHPHNIFLAL